MSNNTKNIIILSHGRCGTNFLCRIFSQYPCISNNNEIAVDFPKQDNIYFFDKELRKNLHKHFPFPKKFNNFVDLARKICKKKFMLFKIFPNHLNGNGWNTIYQPNSIFILLTRNHLDSYLSLAQAELYGSYYLENTTNYKIKFNEEFFEKLYERRKKNLNFINRVVKLYPDLQKKIYKINYEDLILKDKKDFFINKILKNLNINQKIKTNYSLSFGKFKQNKSTNFDFVLNKEEMINYMNNNHKRKEILEKSIYYKKS